MNKSILFAFFTLLLQSILIAADYAPEDAPKKHAWATDMVRKCIFSGSESEEAFAALVTEAKEGNKYAQFELGHLYFAGAFVEECKETAFEYFLAAAQNESIRGRYCLGLMLLRDEYKGEEFKAKGAELYWATARDGLPQAQFDYAIMLMSGTDFVQKNELVATYLLCRAERNGSERAIEKLKDIAGGNAFLKHQPNRAALANIPREAHCDLMDTVKPVGVS